MTSPVSRTPISFDSGAATSVQRPRTSIQSTDLLRPRPSVFPASDVSEQGRLLRAFLLFRLLAGHVGTSLGSLSCLCLILRTVMPKPPCCDCEHAVTVQCAVPCCRASFLMYLRLCGFLRSFALSGARRCLLSPPESRCGAARICTLSTAYTTQPGPMSGQGGRQGHQVLVGARCALECPHAGASHTCSCPYGAIDTQGVPITRLSIPCSNLL